MIKQRIYDADGYIVAHRLDPAFKDAVRNNVVFGPILIQKHWGSLMPNFCDLKIKQIDLLESAQQFFLKR